MEEAASAGELSTGVTTGRAFERGSNEADGACGRSSVPSCS